MSKNILALNPTDIKIDISVEKNEEQVESWKRVFGVDERYKDLICKKNDL